MCYSVLECLLGACCRGWWLSTTMWASPASERTDRRRFKAGPCWVPLTFGDRPRTPQSAPQLGVMVLSFSSRHSPLVDFKDQPTCSIQQGLRPIVKTGPPVTYEISQLPGQLWCSENSGLGRIGIFLFKKG